MNTVDESFAMGAIAIIGMNGRFPGANSLEDFWQNLYNGVESVQFFNRDQLLKMGIDEHLLDNPRFVAADALLDGMDLFDAAFFDYSAREAEIMDPQHRLFLESAWEVLESAGYNSDLYKGRVAVYAGANLSGYMVRNLYSNPGLVENVGTFKIMIANSQDFLATKVSYKMNLTGPSVNVNTLCSSSMVAVHMACQNLLNYSCDMALAGGVSFQISRNEAFFYQEGGIGSGDGHCRAFDSKANGTVSGSGLGVLVLKRLEDAIADGDTIHAVIRGTGINNDGSDKNSYTAPNVDGQAECIAEALAMSGVDPETITYIDAHGTGTDLGDPIEIAALTKAFRAYTDKKQFCAIGSVKTNIGHLVTAGGVASMVKTILAMKHRTLPASLNFEEPNPKIDFVNSPFYINNKLAKWEGNGNPLRAGVSSFGIGGTNTHVILEEAPEQQPSEASARPWQLIILSAKTETALEQMTKNLAAHIEKNPQESLADIAFTLHVGRRSFNHRRAFVCRDTAELLIKLQNADAAKELTRYRKPKEQPNAFLFPSEAVFYTNAGRELYESEPVYKEALDRCADIAAGLLGSDFRSLLYPQTRSKQAFSAAEETVRVIAFSVEYALAQLWISAGIQPECMLGEGVGEVVCACISGVLSLEDALKLVSAKEIGTLKLTFGKTAVPFISSKTGTWMDTAQASDISYWASQRTCASSALCAGEMMQDPDRIFLELGPADTLSKKLRAAQTGSAVEPDIFSTMPDRNDEESDAADFLRGLARFWLAGGKVQWDNLYSHEKRRRIPLPTYPFERQRFWIEPGKRADGAMLKEIPVRSAKELEALDSTQGTIRLSFELDGERLEEMLRFREELNGLCEKHSVSLSPVCVIKERDDSSEGEGKLSKMPRPDLDTPFVAPRNETERIIAEYWQKVLGYETVGVQDDFFTLGGHSLLAAAIATEMSKVFEVQIPMRELFEATTVEEIAKLVETYQWALQAQEAAGEAEEVEDGVL